MKLSKDIKLIKFLGDSFVWGQGLDNYEYDVHQWDDGGDEFILNEMGVDSWGEICSTKNIKLGDDYVSYIFNKSIDNSNGIDFSTYPDDMHYYKSRFKSIVKQRWATTVCDRLECKGITKSENGGSIIEVTEHYCTELTDSKPDLAIILLSSYQRDEWGKYSQHTNKDEHLYFNKIKPEIVSKVIMRDMVYELREMANEHSNFNKFKTEIDSKVILRDMVYKLWKMADSFELDELKLWYAKQMQKFNQDWFPEHYHREIYIGIFEYFKEMELKHGVPILFIGSWLEDGELVFKEEGEIFDWYRDRLIPIKYDNKEFASFYPLIEEYKLTIGNDFNIDDNHPSKELHDVVANSVIEYLEKEK